MGPDLGRVVSQALELADRIFARVRAADQVWGAYTLDLTLEALLACYQAGGPPAYRDYVLAVLKRRGFTLDDPRCSDHQPFVHLAYALYRCTGEAAVAQQFLTTSRRILETTPRDQDGLVLHRTAPGHPGRALVDFMHDYVARMVRAWALSGDRAFLTEAADQVQRHRAVVRNPETGLWHQGRGWEEADPRQRSPAAWSRGQGWIMHGLTLVEPELSKDASLHATWHQLIHEFGQTLLRYQQASGCWPCLMGEASSLAVPETSGTALITAAFYRMQIAHGAGNLAWAAAADRAFKALVGRVDERGVVSGVCAGPGPLNAQLLAQYQRACFPEDGEHGAFAVLFACAARARVDAQRSRHGWV